MRIKKFPALLTALAIMLGLASCGAGGGMSFSAGAQAGKGDGTQPSNSGGVEQGYYSSVWHGDVDYSDMEYVHYDYQEFLKYVEPIYDMAENGGDQEDFYNADYELYDQLYYIYTLYTLADLRATSDVTDQDASQEALYMQDVYYDAIGSYYDAMHAVAVSENAELMESSYSQSLIDYFAAYQPSGDEDREIYSLENDLVNQYFSLISQPEPDYDAIGEIFVQLVELRQRDAQLLGYDSYADYAYESVFYKDYAPEDAQIVWQGVKDYIVPVMMSCGHSVQEKSDLLYSADLDCSVGAILSALEFVLPQISEELYEAYEYMCSHGLYDIGYSEDKVSTGFTTVLYYYNEPFIFNAPTKTYRDYTDMFHEFGHFANYFYTESDLVFGMSDYDLSELQSQGLEVLATFFYDDIFGSSLGEAMADSIILSMVFSIVDGAMYDEFLQRVYSMEDLTVEKVTEIFKDLYDQYGYAPYDGYEYEWMYVNHNFESPFYYISYAVSAIGALEIFSLAQEDFESGAEKYLTVSAMDTENCYYSQALSQAGFSDIFSESTYSDLADALYEALA